jgi:hypothetical protein
MSQTTPFPESPLQRQIVQLAQVLAAKVEAQAQQAPRGRVLADLEGLLLADGRQFLRDALAAALQQQADEADKKGGFPEPVPVDRYAATKAPRRVES